MRFHDLVTQLDPRPHVRGRQFEMLCRWYLKNAPEYRAKVKHVWLWREWPGRWGADAGIDLVAETHAGELWAIQAKSYEPEYAIKKSDVDTFLSESSRAQFAYRLFIATTDGIGNNAYRTLVSQEKKIGLALRSHLAASNVEWPADFESLLPARPHPKTRRPHQQEAIDAVRRGFERADRGQLIMACGTGKTIVALWVAEDLGSQSTLVLVPSLTLLSQTLREWTANAAEPFDYLAVCSDETVAEHDAMVSWTADLGFPVTTNPREIERYLRRDGRKVVFSTYQSAPRIAEALSRGVAPFDLAIADEAHRCTGPTSSEFTIVLDANQIRARRRLFMTATPRYFSERLRREAGEADFEIASMDDESKFGCVFHRLLFGPAIDRDLLSDYQVSVIGVDDETCRRYVDQGASVTYDRKQIMDAGTLASHIGLAKAMRKYDLRRTISFHGRVNRAREFSGAFPCVVEAMSANERPQGRLWSSYVSGEMPTSKRDVLLHQFRELEEHERGLLSNARCLAEGVDVPAIDGVAFIDPRGSSVDIIQAVGRAIRKSEEKNVGTIVLPVFLNRDEPEEDRLSGSPFKPVWDIIKALRAHDNALAEELDALRRSFAKTGGAPISRPSKILLDVPINIGEDFFRAFDVRLVEATTSNWEFCFGLLEQFAERDGHTRVPVAHLENGRRLGAWVNVQRTMFTRGKLTQERRRRLESLPGWAWDARADRWETWYARLEQFTEGAGHARVPDEYSTPEGFGLGPWVGNQRASFARRKLPEERQHRLERLPGWTWEARGDRWEEAFSKLKQFVEREGHARVLATHVEDGFNLGRWINKQRTAFAKRRLNRARQLRLEAIPEWTWDAFTALWEDTYSTLLAFVQREGRARVPQNHVENGIQLGSWITRQRQVFREGELDQERQQRLESLPGWTWDAVTAVWEEGYTNLLQFVGREGHARIPRNRIERGFRLGSWITRQRQVFRAGKLSRERQERLEALPGWTWDTLTDRWEDSFANLLQFVQREGHAQVPREHVEGGFSLGSWVKEQRGGRGRLSGSRKHRLETLPGWSWEKRANQWEEAFGKLTQFVEREGHARILHSHVEDKFNLGTWIDAQRRRFASGKLSEDRQRRLQALPRWAWSPYNEQWEEAFDVLVQFVGREGHSRVSLGHVEGAFPLGKWAKSQRRAYANKTMSQERIQRLEALPGWTWQVRTQRPAS